MWIAKASSLNLPKAINSLLHWKPLLPGISLSSQGIWGPICSRQIQFYASIVRFSTQKLSFEAVCLPFTCFARVANLYYMSWQCLASEEIKIGIGEFISELFIAPNWHYVGQRRHIYYYRHDHGSIHAPPSPRRLAKEPCGSYRYFFSCSRLNSPAII